MNLRFLALTGLSTALLACGASPAPAPVPPGSQPAPSATVSGGTASVEFPAKLAAWIHVEHPARLAAVVRDLSGPPAADASCAKGDLTECLAFVDPSQPIDVAYETTDSGGDVEATVFSVKSLAEFRDRAAKTFETTEPKPGTLQLATKKEAATDKSAAADGGAPAHSDKDGPTLCDVGAAESSHRVVCGNQEGLARLGPWLRTSPRTPGGPASSEDLARAEVYAGPIIESTDKQFASDKASDREAREFAHDFGGATLKLASSDVPGAPLKLNFDLRMAGGSSRWTKVLLTPLANPGPLPDTFGRVAKGATAAFYLPGGGPLVALLDQVGSFGALAGLDPAKVQGVAGELRSILGRPAICAHVMDFDEARASLTHARQARQAGDSKKAEAAIDAGFGSYFVCGVQEPIKSAEQLAHKLLEVSPKKPGETHSLRPAAFSLPKGSFMVESTHPVASTTSAVTGKKPPATKKTEDTLVVPDGDTTWVASGEDVQLTAHFLKRLLEQPKGPVPPAFSAAPGIVASGYLTGLLGSFYMDQMSQSVDKLEATLSNASPGLLRLALSQRTEGAGGTLSINVESDPPTLKRLSQQAMPIGALVLGALMVAASIPDSPSK